MYPSARRIWSMKTPLKFSTSELMSILEGSLLSRMLGRAGIRHFKQGWHFDKEALLR